MNNSFYNDFDTELLGSGEPKRQKGRTPFQQDRDRIIYSPAFRRLQNKTQVFLSGELDFYRTRLTHSIEVAQIGRSICNLLNHTSEYLDPVDNYIDQDLVESICLAHDIGHPSFGHAGEQVLNEIMSGEPGGFEGNAQNLRILLDLFYREGQSWSGMNPTRAFLDGMLKYKTLYADSVKKKNHFLYDDQEPVLDFVAGEKRFKDVLNGEDELNNFKSIECQIMDTADDIAYSIHDISDGIQAGFISIKSIRRWQESKSKNFTTDDGAVLDELCDVIMKDGHSRFLNRKIGEFINSVSLVQWDNHLSSKTNRYAYKVEMDSEQLGVCKLFKSLSFATVFQTPQLHQVEYKGGVVLRKLFDVFMNSDGPKLLPPHYAQIMNAANEKAFDEAGGKREIMDRSEEKRIICDYVSGMTDGFVMRTYKRLFDPDFGSITDII